MHIINVTCAEIQTPAGFVYVILPVLLNHTNNPDCEQSWYLQDGRLIADPANPQALIDPVISVSSDRLVTSHCVNLNHEIICDSPDGLHFSRVTAFRAKNETAATPNSISFQSCDCIQSEESNCSDSKLRRLSRFRLPFSISSHIIQAILTKEPIKSRYETVFKVWNETDSISGSTPESPESQMSAISSSPDDPGSSDGQTRFWEKLIWKHKLEEHGFDWKWI
ncbi:hypothetical protein G5714_004048 [Onychostoma macrolepis]|uniref:Uncharacterized protein n=1 Tax=Onychostoma macrolepis TaxID=369639 RepID=A0A7J6DBH8_9TELE|nr:hypothetical protein G5714_004048 [Onychostoma macrolepis]